MYHDSDNIVVSEPGRFSVETARGTAAITTDYKTLNGTKHAQTVLLGYSTHTHYSTPRLLWIEQVDSLCKIMVFIISRFCRLKNVLNSRMCISELFM